MSYLHSQFYWTTGKRNLVTDNKIDESHRRNVEQKNQTQIIQTVLFHLYEIQNKQNRSLVIEARKVITLGEDSLGDRREAVSIIFWRAFSTEILEIHIYFSSYLGDGCVLHKYRKWSFTLKICAF